MTRFTLDSIISIVFALIIFPCLSNASVLTSNTVWKGEVALNDDILVPAGVTLTIAPGTVIRASNAETTKTDPEYLSPLVEITVRGTLKAEGKPEAPISFLASGGRKAGVWAGIIIDGGTASLSYCLIEGAEAGVHLLDGNLAMKGTAFSGNRYGVVLQGKKGSVQGGGNLISDNDYGLVSYEIPAEEIHSFASISSNRKKDVLFIPRGGKKSRKEYSEQPEERKPTLSRHYDDAVLKGETVWRERVVVDGIVRVPEGSRLVVMPGTIVEFGFKDTNHDGIGENGLLVQGVVIAKGTPSAPIVFRSSDGKGHKGGWDAINIMNSGDAWNVIEHCRIEDAYRGLHFHFSRVAVTNSVFTGNYRGIQFQESAVLLRGDSFYGNKSAVQGRDSEVTFSNNRVYDNVQGVNFFRVKLVARNNRIVGNDKEGLRIREGATVLEENLIDGNRYGLLVMDAFFGTFAHNSISNNGEIGFSLKNTDNMEITGNFISGNGMNGLNLQDTRGRISGNLISDNGERGVGIQSYAGVLEGNNLSANGLYAVDLEGSTDVPAMRNWWGGDVPDKVIYDKKNDATKGRVDHGQPAASPFPFSWPLNFVETRVTWRGDIAVSQTITVTTEGTLTLTPKTRALFTGEAGLAVRGRIIAIGKKDAPVSFTSAVRKAGAWDEILLEHADGSSFDNCIFEYATWGLHCHFTRLTVKASLFRHNSGGLRFRSGPVEVTGSLFTNNDIAIRDFRGNALIAENVITGNRTGIFVREKGGGLTVRGNNLFANMDYNVRIGDFNNEDVDARGNWWGKGSPGATIFDGREEPGIGMVRFEPYLPQPAHLGWMDSK